MKNLLVFALMFVAPYCLLAEEATGKISPPMIEDKDGDIKSNEYQNVSTNGSVTRRPCPYTCEDRGIAKENCKTWPSPKSDWCYVWDTRLPQDSIPLAESTKK